MVTTTSLNGLFKIGIVIGSQRAGRICPQVAQFVHDVIKSHHASTQAAQTKLEFEFLDIAKFDLPLTDEPGMPAHITDRPLGYKTEKTRAWSTAVAAVDAFVFVVPQYNWGMPAALKNALDHLFHEWGGKPAMVVAYGGHGGTMSAAMLITILSGMFLQVVKRPLCMSYPDSAFLGRAVDGGELGLDAKSDEGVWADQKAAIVGLWDEMFALLPGGVKRPSLRSPGLLELWEETLAPVVGIEKKMAAKAAGGS